MADDPRQRLQRDLEDAYRRGQLDETVKTVQSRMSEISAAIRDIQSTMDQLTTASVSVKRFEALEVRVEGLEGWKLKILGGVGVIVFLLQIIPLIWKLRGSP